MTVFATGFRPFFILAAAFAAFQVPLWVLGLLQIVAPTGGVSWHAHEMLFGFTGAVIAGFLLTAARNWTHRETASGASLAVLCALWLAGRIVVGKPELFPARAAIFVDSAFFPALAFFVARPIIAVKQWRQLGILSILGALTVCNLVFHLSPIHQRTAWLVALDLILALIVIIGGRVIPMFTRNATRTDPTTHAWIERLSMGSVLLLVLAELTQASILLGGACLVCGTAQTLRLHGWVTRRIWSLPILWVLHMGYGWLCLGLLCRGAAKFVPSIPETATIHMLTTGAIGMLTLGMMARVALGHTGRPMVAPRFVVAGFVLVSVAAAMRAFAPIFTPGMTTLSYAVSATAWSAAFVAYLINYSHSLVSARADGQPG